MQYGKYYVINLMFPVQFEYVQYVVHELNL